MANRRMLHQVVEYTCDGCGIVKVYELAGVENHPETIKELEEWIIFTREIWVPGKGFVKAGGQACSQICVKIADDKVMAEIAEMRKTMQAENEAADNIDLSALSVN